MPLLGGIGWSFRSTGLSNQTRGIHSYQMHSQLPFDHATLSLYSNNINIEWPNGNSNFVETIDAVCDFYSLSLQERNGN